MSATLPSLFITVEGELGFNSWPRPGDTALRRFKHLLAFRRVNKEKHFEAGKTLNEKTRIIRDVDTIALKILITPNKKK